MCPSGGHGGGLRERLRRALGYWRNLEEQPHTLLVPAAALLLVLLYCFPVLSALLLCAAAAWLYRTYPDWRPGPAAAAGRRQRTVVHRRHREPALKWTPASLLLLMGSYLGKQEPPPRAVGRGTRELKERLTRPNTTVATPARRLSFRETPAVSNRSYLSPRRRYPIHQPQYSLPGSLPTVYLDGFQKKCLLSPKSSSIRSPVTVKIARPDPNGTRSPVLDSLLSPGPAVQCAPDPCAKETVLNAIRESRKRMNKEDHKSSGGLESKRRRHASSENEDMLCEYTLPNGTVLSYTSKPDSLKRGPSSQVLEDQLNKRSRTSSVSSIVSSAVNGIAASTHNAITSSYSSSRDLQKRKRCLLNTSAVSSSPNSRSQTPDLSAKKARDDSHETSPSTSLHSERNHSGTSNETPSRSPTVNSSTENGSLDGRRKKLLLVSGSRDHYPLPPPPLVGYSITSKDFDLEKKASLQRLNKALKDPSGQAPLSSGSTTASTTSTSLFSVPTSSTSPNLPAASSTTLTAALDLPSSSNSNPLLLSLAKMQDKDSSQASTTSLKTELKAPASITLTCPEPTKPSDHPLKLTSISSISAPPVVVPINGLPSAPTIQATPEPPKPNLLQIPPKPLESDSQPTFKPIFPASGNAISTASTTFSTSNTFAPVFKDPNEQPAPPNPTTFKSVFGSSTTQAPVSTSPFTFQSNTASTSAPSLFSSTFAATSTNPVVGADPASKPPMALSTSSSTNTLGSSLFSSAAVSSSGFANAPANTLLGSNAPSEPTAKQFVFGQGSTSQTTSGLNMFSSVPSTAASVTQPQPPSLFGSKTSAFTATVSSNPPAFPTNSGTSAFGSTQGTGVKAEAPAQSTVAGFGSSGTLPAFGTAAPLTFGNAPQPTINANSQPAFGTNTTLTLGNSTPAPKETFGSAQINSTPAGSVFGSKPFTFGGNAGSTPSFGTPNATPAQSLGFGNVAQNNSIATPSATFSFGTPGLAENKPAFAPFNQNSPAPSFSTSTPAFGAGGAFSIGSTPKPSGARQRVMARRQHQRKK